jgi:DNA-binding NtrC family response regulator
MLRYDWPMNIRELAQAIGAASVLARDRAIGSADLPGVTRGPASPSDAPRAPLDQDDDDIRRAFVKRWGLDRTSFK